jgi:hypothetical protein
VEVELRLAFLGTAVIYQGAGKFDVDAALYTEGRAPAASFFGHYSGGRPEGIRSGPALIRFSDGSEAEAVLAEIDPDRGGFRLTSSLRDLRTGT